MAQESTILMYGLKWEKSKYIFTRLTQEMFSQSIRNKIETTKSKLRKEWSGKAKEVKWFNNYIDFDEKLIYNFSSKDCYLVCFATGYSLSEIEQMYNKKTPIYDKFTVTKGMRIVIKVNNELFTVNSYKLDTFNFYKKQNLIVESNITNFYPGIILLKHLPYMILSNDVIERGRLLGEQMIKNKYPDTNRAFKENVLKGMIAEVAIASLNNQETPYIEGNKGDNGWDVIINNRKVDVKNKDLTRYSDLNIVYTPYILFGNLNRQKSEFLFLTFIKDNILYFLGYIATNKVPEDKNISFNDITMFDIKNKPAWINIGKTINLYKPKVNKTNKSNVSNKESKVKNNNIKLTKDNMLDWIANHDSMFHSFCAENGIDYDKASDPNNDKWLDLFKGLGEDDIIYFIQDYSSQAWEDFIYHFYHNWEGYIPFTIIINTSHKDEWKRLEHHFEELYNGEGEYRNIIVEDNSSTTHKVIISGEISGILNSTEIEDGIAENLEDWNIDSYSIEFLV